MENELQPLCGISNHAAEGGYNQGGYNRVLTIALPCDAKTGQEENATVWAETLQKALEKTFSEADKMLDYEKDEIGWVSITNPINNKSATLNVNGFEPDFPNLKRFGLLLIELAAWELDGFETDWENAPFLVFQISF